MIDKFNSDLKKLKFAINFKQIVKKKLKKFAVHFFIF